MSLTSVDPSQIRKMSSEEMKSLEVKVENLEKDFKDIKDILTNQDKEIEKPSLKRGLLKLNRNLLQTAKEAGVTLPR